MNIHDHIQLWNQANVRVLDVRYALLEPGERLHRYTLPASAFVYATRGRGRLWLDGDAHYADRLYVLHGGKGTSLEIETETQFEYYLILYKAVLPQNCLYEFQMLMQSDNPFELPYGFAPYDALELLEFMQSMHRDWSESSGLDKLLVRGGFYQFVHRLLRQMQHSPEEATQHSLTEQVLRFLTEHYQESKSIESLSLLLNYSPQYLSRKFKEQTGLSPTEYIIKLRMEKAQHLLLTTDASLKEIASRVGYADLFYFNRIFKKYVDIAPGQFRNKHLARQEQGSNHTKKQLKNSIVKKTSQIYINYDNENHYHNIEKGDYIMYKGSHSVMLSTLWFCLTIMLSACAAGSNAPVSTSSNSSEGTQTSSGKQSDISPTDAAQSSGTKTISTLFGDVTIPLVPKRVAAVDYLGTVIALGVKPIGSNDLLMKSPYLEGHLEGVEGIGDSFEKLLAMEPDLIITHTTKPEVYDKYSQIAPTVSVASNTFNSVHEEMTYFGEVLGKETESVEWLNQYDNYVAEAKERIKGVLPKNATFSVFQEYDGQVFVFGAKSGRGGRNIYQTLGLKAPSAIPDKVMEKAYTETSLEKLSEYAGDYIVLTTDATLVELQADPIWGSLKAVREGRVYLWNEERSWYRDPIALLSQTQKLVDWMVGLSQQK